MNFEYFWSLYPRRVSKRAAQKAWEKEIRSGTDPEAIITGLKRQLPHFATKDEQFIPHASTWLNQGRFEDEVSSTPQRPSNRRETIADVAREFLAGRTSSAGGYYDPPIGISHFGKH